MSNNDKEFSSLNDCINWYRKRFNQPIDTIIQWSEKHWANQQYWENYLYFQEDYECKYTMTDDKRKELHQEFYNAHKPLVVALTDIFELQAHIEELEVICARAKATLRCAADEMREREANLSKEDRQKLLSQSNPLLSGSDAINTVKQRKDRMTKADKTAESFRALGMSEEEIASLMSNMNLNAVKFAIENKDKIKEAEDRKSKAIEEKKALDLAEKLQDTESVKADVEVKSTDTTEAVSGAEESAAELEQETKTDDFTNFKW